MTKKIYHVGQDLLLRSSSVEKTAGDNKEKENLLLAKSLNIGYYLVIPLLLGVFFGVGIDAHFGTKPVFTIVFLILGVVSTFYNLFTIVTDGKRTTH